MNAVELGRTLGNIEAKLTEMDAKMDEIYACVQSNKREIRELQDFRTRITGGATAAGMLASAIAGAATLYMKLKGVI